MVIDFFKTNNNKHTDIVFNLTLLLIIFFNHLNSFFFLNNLSKIKTSIQIELMHGIFTLIISCNN